MTIEIDRIFKAIDLSFSGFTIKQITSYIAQYKTDAVKCNYCNTYHLNAKKRRENK